MHSDVLAVSASGHFHNLQLQKSPSRVVGQNSGNSADISKAFSEMGIWKFESSQVSQAVTQLEIVDHRIRQVPANCGLLWTGCPSLYSQFEQLGSEIADSLRPTFEIFPFFGDASQRPGAISTAWCRTQSWLDYFQGSGSRCSISKTGECLASPGSAI